MAKFQKRKLEIKVLAMINFIPENKKLTFGQMSQKLKFKNDHRAKAFKN